MDERRSIPCTVFMWATANPIKVAATRGYGAEVNLEAETPAEAHERLLAFVEETGRAFVHPFDDPVLQAGHGTLGLEVVEDVPDVETIVVPIGGGGLIAGVASGASMLTYTVSKEANPPSLSGTATGVVSFLNLTFSALVGPVFGSIMKGLGAAERTPLERYQVTFEPLLYGVALAMVLTLALKETGRHVRVELKTAVEAA